MSGAAAGARGGGVLRAQAGGETSGASVASVAWSAAQARQDGPCGAVGGDPRAPLAESLGQIADCLVALGEAVRELVRKGDLQLAAGRGSALMDPMVPPTSPPVAPRPARLLKADDLAEVFGVNSRTVRAWRAAGKLPPAIVVGGICRWDAAVFERWLAEQQEGSR